MEEWYENDHHADEGGDLAGGYETAAQRQQQSGKTTKKKGDGSNSKEEKEFMDQSTKKNLMNVKSKLDRAMADLSMQVMPVMILNGPSASRHIRTMTSSDSADSLINMPMDRKSKQRASTDIFNKLQADSRLSSKNRRSSFGSVDAENLAQSMVDNAQKMGKQDCSENVFTNLGMDIILRKENRIQHPLVARNLRELVMVDDRLDSEDLHEKQFKTTTGIDWEARRKAEAIRKDEMIRQHEAAKARAARLAAGDGDEDDGEVELEPVPVRTPRMRHTRSYRCASQKELNEFRTDMKNHMNRHKGGLVDQLKEIPGDEGTGSKRKSTKIM